jgi:hypothetical protein
MKFNTTMPQAIKLYYRQELSLAKESFYKQHYQESWRFLERAHILSQPYPNEHTAVHWEMLKFGIRLKNKKEVLGQIPRLLIGGVKSFVGKVPVGNTGGANVPALLPMEIPNDLQKIIDSVKSKK